MFTYLQLILLLNWYAICLKCQEGKYSLATHYAKILQKLFWMSTAKRGINDNPTVKQTLRIVDSFCSPVVKGNCQGNMIMKVIDKENINCTLQEDLQKGEKLEYSVCSY